MKKRNRLLSLLLCAAMVLSLFGCTGDPAPTQPRPTDPPAPTEPPGLLAYEAALPALEAAADVTLRISSSTRTSVAGEQFAKGSDEILVYTGLGTDTLTISSRDQVNYDGMNFMEYLEVYTDGKLYLDAEDSNAGTVSYFRTETTAEEAAGRYLPVALLDAALYGSVTMEETKDGTCLTFTDPTAAEAWAMPEDAELVEADGTALINASGALTRFTYRIVYTHGAAKVTRETTSEVAIGAAPIHTPASDTKYRPIADLDAIRLYNEGACYMAQAHTVTSSIMESTMSQAGGIIQNESTMLDMYYTDTTLDAKIDTNIYANIMGEDQEYKQEELFVDGSYTIAVDGGEPEGDITVTAEMISDHGFNMLYTSTITPAYWKDVTITDLGSIQLLEFEIINAAGPSIIRSLSELLYGDPDLLDDNATSSGVNALKGYFALDKYTGLPTAAGYNLDAYHVLEGQNCMLTYQADQSYEIPSLGAYHTITDEQLNEARPIDKATPLFYHVTGDDGQEMWLLGTIHVGDNRTAYLPQEIYDAFAASDALALEYDSDAFDEEVEENEALQDAISEAYYYSDGSTTADHLDEEVYNTAVQYLKATGNYNMNAEYMKPYLWSSSIENFFLRQGYSLTSHQGVETRLEKLAEEQDKEVRSVESGLFQIQMLTGYSDDLQELMLSDTVQYNAMEYWTETDELFELWCRGDEAALREELTDDTSELTEEELALYNEYNDAMLVDRNAGMLDVAVDYLESGDVVFYAVGLAHLISGGNGLVDTLRDAGYTVELVTYAE